MSVSIVNSQLGKTFGHKPNQFIVRIIDFCFRQRQIDIGRNRRRSRRHGCCCRDHSCCRTRVRVASFFIRQQDVRSVRVTALGCMVSLKQFLDTFECNSSGSETYILYLEES